LIYIAPENSNFDKVVLMVIVAVVLNRPLPARAALVTATLTGTVTQGTDYTGTFVAPGADLAGYPYTLIYTMDDQKGFEVGTGCDNSERYAVTQAVLTINGASYTLGTHDPITVDSEVDSSNPTSSQTELYFYFYDYRAAGFNFTGTEYVFGTVNLNSIHVCRNWESPFSYTLVPAKGDEGVFNVVVDLYDNNTQVFGFGGVLSVQTVSVSGPCNTPQLGSDSGIDSSLPACMPPKVIVNTNDDCYTDIGPACSANIVLANELDQTLLYYSVTPAQVFDITSTASFGTVTSPVRSTTYGNAQGAYTSGALSLNFRDTATTVATVTPSNGGPGSKPATVFNYGGFNFHQSQVSDASFGNIATMATSDIQKFLSNHHSFLAHFILVGTDEGFEDLHGTGVFEDRDPTYSTSGEPVLTPGTRGTSVATLIYQAAIQYTLNPQVLLATAQKEKSLISAPALPTADILNYGMGCRKPTNFKTQIMCAASTLTGHFKDTTDGFGHNITYPFFFRATNGIRQYVTNSGLQAVGFSVDNAATYTQYRYTPYIQALSTSGGVYQFELEWAQYHF
jgi:hypothetical protein